MRAVRADEPLPRSAQRFGSASRRRSFAGAESGTRGVVSLGTERSRRASTSSVASPVEDPLGDARALVRACADGDGAARRRFQDRFAEDIYNFPIKICGLSADRAADFYVYVFDRDRIFTRMRSFEGRGGMQLRTFLAFHVLRALFVDWQRGERELDTVSLNTPIGQGQSGAVLEDVLVAEQETSSGPDPATDDRCAELLESLTPEESLDVKLLSLLEHELSAEDVRLLAKISRRTLDATVAAVAEIQAALCARDARVAALSADLDSAWGWLVLRRRELQETEESLRLLEPGNDTTARARLVERREDLLAAIEKRSRQHARTLEELRGYKVTTSYKDIAKLKNSTVGTVCSRIFRLRQRLEQRWASLEAAS
jgi:RNA polymerase sigma factor (sigma-70 family)